MASPTGFDRMDYELVGGELGAASPSSSQYQVSSWMITAHLAGVSDPTSRACPRPAPEARSPRRPDLAFAVSGHECRPYGRRRCPGSLQTSWRFRRHSTDLDPGHGQAWFTRCLAPRSYAHDATRRVSGEGGVTWRPQRGKGIRTGRCFSKGRSRREGRPARLCGRPTFRLINCARACRT